MKILAALARLLVAILLVAAEGVFWLRHGLREVRLFIRDALAGRRALADGTLRCPRGHTVFPVEDEMYECASCGFRYEVGEGRSIWECPNVECGATTPFVHCPTCWLSVRNPWRWGRP